MVTKVTAFWVRLIILFTGFIWYSQEEVKSSKDEEPAVYELYRKFLGPDWKPKFTGAGVTVSNHQSILDVFAMFRPFDNIPGFLAKKDIKNVPGVGMISQVMGCLFTDRTGTASEAKARVLLQIKDK